MTNALDDALLLKANPDRLFFQQRQPLPDGVALLIRIAINPAACGLSPVQRQGLDDAELQAAAGAYLKGVCLFPGSQGLRVLGLNDGSDHTLVVEHRRLLLKWLHPDRNPENRHLAERVNRAWGQLKLGRGEPVRAPLPPGFGVEPVPVEVLRGSRFPLFLAGLTLLAAAFWLWSLRPDATEYVGDAPTDSAQPPAFDAAGQRDADDGQPLPEVALTPWGGEPAAAPVQAAPAEPVPAIAAMPESAVADTPAATKAAQAPKTPAPEPKSEAMARLPEPRTAESPIKPARKPPVAAATPPDTAVRIEPTQAVSAPPAPPPQTLTPADAQAALQRFVQLYRAGEIEPFMAQFSADARNNRGGRQAIREDYARLFLQSKRRDLAFSATQWQAVPGGMRFKADYRSKVAYQGQLTGERNSGRIEIVFRREDGQVRIASVMVVT